MLSLTLKGLFLKSRVLALDFLLFLSVPGGAGGVCRLRQVLALFALLSAEPEFMRIPIEYS